MAKTKTNLGGRPTKYGPKMLEMAQDHLQWCKENGDRLPTECSLALRLGVCIRTVRNWKNEHPEFAFACERVHLHQHGCLVQKGLAGQYNPAPVKMMLMSHHGYRERSDSQEMTRVQEVPPMSDEEWAKFVKNYRDAGDGIDRGS